MAAKNADGFEAPSSPAGSFADVEETLALRLLEAASADIGDNNYDYILSGWRSETAHHVAVICVADTVEPLSARRTEKLRLAIPIKGPDPAVPIPILGTEGARYFFLTYLAQRGGIKELRVTPEVYADRFTGRRKPPVADLAAKLRRYRVVPMRERERPEDLTE